MFGSLRRLVAAGRPQPDRSSFDDADAKVHATAIQGGVDALRARRPGDHSCTLAFRDGDRLYIAGSFDMRRQGPKEVMQSVRELIERQRDEETSGRTPR